MISSDLLELRNMLARSSALLAFSGYMTEPVRLAVGETLKQKLAMDDVSTKTMRSVFAVFVEQMQNIIRYSAESAPENSDNEEHALRYGILTIGRDGDNYVLMSGNLVLHEDTERVMQKLTEIQSMDHDQLKRHYKNKLKEGPDKHSKGAGIGFIEIARRASRPIEFDFKKIDDKYSFFALKAII